MFDPHMGGKQSTTENILSRFATSSPHPPKCRQCTSTQTRNRGTLPKGRKFADQSLNPPLPGGNLYECANCRLVFRYPILQESEYEALYETVSGEYWESNGLRGDQRKICDVIRQRFSSGKILDVGCYDGALLSSLGDAYEKFGVEASQEAAKISSKRRVCIVASKIRELEHIHDSEFDVITAVNVIEHVHDPKGFIKALSLKLKPGGVLIISTGNAHAPSWAWLGARFWYCALPDHLSFISPQWSLKVAEELGLKLSEVTEFRYNPSTGMRAIYEWLELPLKCFISAFEMLIIRQLSSTAKKLGPRLCLGRRGMFKDHFLAVFVKNLPCRARY